MITFRPRIKTLSDYTFTLRNEAPLLPFVLALAAGIALAWTAHTRYNIPATASIVCFVSATAAFSVSIGLALLRRAPFLKKLFLFLSFASFGAALLQHDLKQVVLTWPAERATYKGEVRSIVKRNAQAESASFDLILKSGPHPGARIRATLKGNAACKLQPGDAILLNAEMQQPHAATNPSTFNYAHYLFHQGISATAYADAHHWQHLRPAASPSLIVRLLRWRSQLTARLSQHLNGDALAVMSALTLGDKSLLQKSTRQRYSDTGASHVLALSGLHLSILFGLLSTFVFARMRRRWLIVGVAIVLASLLWLFVAMVGTPLSLARAAAMFTIILCCRSLRQDVFPINNLCLAALLSLLHSPQALFDVGFQLSFSAVFSIVWLEGTLWRHYDDTLWPAWFRRLYAFTTVSLSAQIGTLPLVAYYFHLIPTVGFVANFLVIPAAYVLIGLALTFFLIPSAQPAAASLITQVVKAQHGVLDVLAQCPGATLHVWPTALTVVLLYAFVLSLLRYTKRRRAGTLLALSAIGLALIGGWYLREYDRQRMPQIWIYDAGRHPAVHFVASRRDAYLWSTAPDSALTRLQPQVADFWRERHWSAPILVREGRGTYGTAGQTARLITIPQVASFAGHHIALLTTSLRHTHTESALPVDALILSRGFSDPIHEALRRFPTRLVVLDASLSAYHRQRLRHACDSLKVAYKDMEETGAIHLGEAFGEK